MIFIYSLKFVFLPFTPILLEMLEFFDAMMFICVLFIRLVVFIISLSFCIVYDLVFEVY